MESNTIRPIFFNTTSGEFGFLSNFFPSPFTDSETGLTFQTVEQWVHNRLSLQKKTNPVSYFNYQKAIHAKDNGAANAILAARTPKEAKRLGRSIGNFPVSTWNSISRDVMKNGLFHKFTQHENFAAKLKATKGRAIFEANKDSIWGIGVKIREAEINYEASSTAHWGTNYLGVSLVNIRESLEQAPQGTTKSSINCTIFSLSKLTTLVLKSTTSTKMQSLKYETATEANNALTKAASRAEIAHTKRKELEDELNQVKAQCEKISDDIRRLCKESVRLHPGFYIGPVQAEIGSAYLSANPLKEVRGDLKMGEFSLKV
jgi:ribA/ribD-fused uncharacterized protein